MELIGPFVSCSLNVHAGGKLGGWVQQIPAAGDAVDSPFPAGSQPPPASVQVGPWDDETGCTLSLCKAVRPDRRATRDLHLSFMSPPAVRWPQPFSEVRPSYLVSAQRRETVS